MIKKLIKESQHKLYANTDNYFESLNTVDRYMSMAFAIGYELGVKDSHIKYEVPVYSVDENGNITNYKSATDASVHIKRHPESIRKALKNGTKCADLKWFYTTIHERY